jgi:spermidine/putrescine transport system substrate-binding protein
MIVEFMDLDRWMHAPVTRRRFLRGAGRGGVGLSLAALLAACGEDEPSVSGEGSPGSPSVSPALESLPPVAGELRVAQWPLYVDRAKGGARPTLETFAAETGVEVDYRETINDNQAWFAKLYPQLSIGQPTGWDLMCNADWLVHQFGELGFIEPLHWDALPTAESNMLGAFRDPAYDPGNAHSVPWQGGVTGIAYYPDLAGDISAMADLWNPELEGKVGMLTEMVDTMTLTLLMLGIDPQTATIDDAMRAQEKLIEQRDANIVRQYYGQDYVQELVNKNVYACLAWSGDVFYWKYLGGAPDLEFVVPEEGGVLWASASMIPIEAEHPADAHAFMDFYFRPDIAVQVTDWVLYMTPVEGVQDLMRQKAEQAKGANREYYETLSESPLLFPPADPSAANLYEYKTFSGEEFEQWAEIFNEVIHA